MDATLRALNRFGLGARPGERARIRTPHAWLRTQLDDPAARVGSPPGASREEIAAALRGLRMSANEDQRERQEARRRLIEIALAESTAALTQRVTSEDPFAERLVAFWSNHFCVSAAAKIPVAALAGSYEREAIRPHVLGRFEDMVLASAKHPAMLFYLDNIQSIGPSSRGARLTRRRRDVPRGLNENYARELLELHTLGVNGGYTQEDVGALARILTGWSIDQRSYAFEFRDELHEPGSKRLLGVEYREDGMREGEAAIRALCRHPATASFIATKLVQHFVADQPPAAAVSRISNVFRETNGDLRAVSRALIDLPEAWSNTRKLRTPQEWLVALLRAFSAKNVNENTVRVLRQLRHPLWSPPSPKGFGDTMSEWADPDSLLNRAELARTLASRFMKNVDPRVLFDVVDVDARDPLRVLLADASIPADERIALAIAGPAFQWR
jgi:uncharacterized protein (DUF1800 family)